MKNDKKYELTDETQLFLGRTVRRIRALKDFGDVDQGELGGWVESENNLSQYGKCWIYDDAVVCNNARVADDAVVEDEAYISGYARVYGEAMVYENAGVWGNAQIYGNAQVYDYAEIINNAQVYDHAKVGDYATVADHARVHEEASLGGRVIVDGNSEVYGDVDIEDNAKIHDAEVRATRDYLLFRKWWSDGAYVTWTRSNNMYYDHWTTLDRVEALVLEEKNHGKRAAKRYEDMIRYIDSVRKEDE